MQRTLVRQGVTDPEIQTLLQSLHQEATQHTDLAHNWLSGAGFKEPERLSRQFGIGMLHYGSDKGKVVQRLMAHTQAHSLNMNYLGLPVDPKDPDTTLIHSHYLFSHRLWIPVIDPLNRIVNLDNRTLLDNPLLSKYLPLKGAPREWIWNESAVSRSSVIFIVEGIKDALAVHELCQSLQGADAISVGGTGGMVSEWVKIKLLAYKQAAEIIGDTLHYVVIPDNDVMGRKAAEVLADGIGARILSLDGLGKGDPADHFKSGKLTGEWLSDWEIFSIPAKPVAELKELEAELKLLGVTGKTRVHSSASSEEIEERKRIIKNYHVGYVINALDPSREAPTEGEGKIRCVNYPQHVDTKASLHVYPNRKYGKHPETHTHCYACGFHGDAFDILAAMQPSEFGGGMAGENFVRMLEHLEQLLGIGGLS